MVSHIITQQKRDSFLFLDLVSFSFKLLGKLVYLYTLLNQVSCIKNKIIFTYASTYA